MNIRALLKTNLINLIILILIVVFRLILGAIFNDHDGTSMMSMINICTLVFGLMWVAFTVYSNMAILKEDDIEYKKNVAEIRARLVSVGNKKFYQNERRHLLTMLDSLESRKKYFMTNSDGRMRELFMLTENQLLRNITNASEYIETFDYISGRDSGYVRSMCEESQHLIDKFNMLVELSVTYDDTSMDYDTRELDDMIEALQTMRDTGKGRLGV